jgi:iron complex transport system substrate-binding protein
MIWLSELLYPDAFDYDLYAEAARYYELFYHCTLTREQFAALTHLDLASLNIIGVPAATK